MLIVVLGGIALFIAFVWLVLSLGAGC